MNNNELKHHGILGMKWGVRRFQNKDGSLTPEGKKRLSSGSENTRRGSEIAREGSNLARSIGSIRDTSSKQDLSTMSDNELKDRVNRLNMEQQYSRLSASANTSVGQQYTESILGASGSVLAITSSALAIALSVKQLRDKAG